MHLRVQNPVAPWRIAFSVLILLLGRTDPGRKQQTCPVMPGCPVCFGWFWGRRKLICSWPMLLLYCAPPAGTLCDRGFASFVFYVAQQGALRWEIQRWDHKGKKKDSSQTFAVVQVHVDWLALTEGTERDHVFVRVETHTVERSGVTKLRVDGDLVACGNRTAAALQNTAGTLLNCLFKHHADLCLCSRHTPSHPRCQRRWSSHMVRRCCRSALCSLWPQCTSSQPGWKGKWIVDNMRLSQQLCWLGLTSLEWTLRDDIITIDETNNFKPKHNEDFWDSATAQAT